MPLTSRTAPGCFAGLLVIGALAGVVLAAGRSGDVRVVRTSTGPMIVELASPELSDSPAYEIDSTDAAVLPFAQLRAKPGAPALRLTNRVVVRYESDARPLRQRGRRVEPLGRDGSLRHYGVIQAATVDEAIRLADSILSDQGVDDAFVDVVRPRVLRGVPDDPRFSYEWNLVNDLDPLFDVNVEPVWDSGYTGAGVVVGIVEDSWQRDHVDLVGNYDAAASLGGGVYSSHATGCAGIVAATAFNDSHGAGVAYGASISSLVFGSDVQDAAALAHRNDLNDIKSNSWGPSDTGVIAYLPSVVKDALREGTETGRDGLGEVYVWAAGNGAGSNDRVDYDSYASSRYVMAVGAIGDLDTLAAYSEPGSALFVVAQSDGNNRKIYSTDIDNGETFLFGGTSAAAPLVAGVCALMLEARPDLSWRDVRHVLLNSARRNDPAHASWGQNGAGHWINERYGYGAVDAAAAVALAETWRRASHEISADSGVVPVQLAIPDNNTTGVTQSLEISEDLRLESVEVVLNVTTTYVGDLEIVLTSPDGTQSVLARRRNDSTDHLNNFVFTSERLWDERSAGTWSLRMADLASGDRATWVNWQLVLHGTPGCPGDLDRSGSVDLIDLSTLLVAFGNCEGDSAFVVEADLDNSGCNDLEDLARLLERFGENCD